MARGDWLKKAENWQGCWMRKLQGIADNLVAIGSEEKSFKDLFEPKPIEEVQLERVQSQKTLTFPTLTDDQKRQLTDRNSPNCPFYEVVGNDRAIELLSLIAFNSLGHPNHLCDMNFAITGNAGGGKTKIARCFGKLLGVPFAEISPKAIKTSHDILLEIERACANFNPPIALELVKSGESPEVVRVKPPPMIVFLDESHALKKSVVQELLKATERSDAVMTCVNKDDCIFLVDCSNISWFMATTDRGDLFDAFDTRFEKIALQLYSNEEIALIVQKNNPDFSLDTCRLVAKFSSRVPREAISFAKLMRQAQAKNRCTWQQAAVEIAVLKGIDGFGMSEQRLSILKALGQQGGLALSRLAAVAGCKEEELKKFILPWLLASTSDQSPLVTVTNKHYITEAGLAELNKRNIVNIGVRALSSDGGRNIGVNRLGLNYNNN